GSRLEDAGAGSREGVGGGRGKGGGEGGGGGTAWCNRPPYPASFGAAAPVRRWGAGARAAGTALQPPSAGVVCAASSGARTTALRRFRAHPGRRAPGQGRSKGEPRNAAEMDARGGAVARAAPAAPGRARVARAARLLWRTGHPGQLALSLAGRPWSGLPSDRADR